MGPRIPLLSRFAMQCRAANRALRFDKPLMVTVRSAMPGRLAMLMWFVGVNDVRKLVSECVGACSAQVGNQLQFFARVIPGQ